MTQDRDRACQQGITKARAAFYAGDYHQAHALAAQALDAAQTTTSARLFDTAAVVLRVCVAGLRRAESRIQQER